MIIKAIHINNYGVYAGEQHIHPAYDKTGEKVLTLIGGMNGGGKTSLLDAILLALYGNRSSSARGFGRGYTSYLESLINKFAPKEEGSYIELEIETRDDSGLVQLRVKRSWRVINVRATEQLEVWRNGQLDPFLAQTWDSYVEDLVPSGLAGLFFFDGEKVSALAEADETPLSVQEAIRSMLGLDLVDRLINDLGTVIKHNNKDNDNTIGEQFHELQQEQILLNQKREKLKQDWAQNNNELERASEQLRVKQEEYIHQGGPIAERQTLLRREAESIQEELIQERTELINYAGNALPLLLVDPMLRRINTRSQQEQSGRLASQTLGLLIERNKRLIDWIANHPGTKEIMGGINQVLASQENELKNLSNQNPIYPLSDLGLAHLEELIDHSLEAFRNDAIHTMSKLEQLETKQENINRHLQVQMDQENISKQLEEINNYFERVANLKQRKSDIEQKISKVENELRQIESRLKRSFEMLNKTQESQRVIAFATKSRETMRIFREQVTKHKIERLSNEIESAFSYLTHKSGLINSVKINLDTLAITLLDSQGNEIIKNRLSSGERQMLAISILWGLARASGRHLPVIIDTPMGRLDSSHRMNFVERYLPNASHQVLVLSTDTEIVGTYLDKLKPHIGRSYLLNYDDNKMQTKVMDGYFQGEGVENL